MPGVAAAGKPAATARAGPGLTAAGKKVREQSLTLAICWADKPGRPGRSEPGDSMEGEARTWWVMRGTEKYGPYTRTELKTMAAEGNVAAIDQIWKEGLKAPILASSIAGMVFGEPPAPAQAAAPAPATPGPTNFDAPFNPYGSPEALLDLPADEVNEQGFTEVPRRVAASKGASWISRGWDMITAAPLWWGMAFLVWSAFNYLTGQFGALGALLSMLLGPVMSAGLQAMAYTADQGDQPDFGTVFSGFRRNTGMLMLLGLLFVALVVIAAIITLAVAFVFILGGGIMEQASHLDQWAQHPELLKNMLSGDAMMHLALLGLLFLVFILMIANAYWFATPLVFFLGVNPALAMAISFRACMKNFSALLVYGLVLLLVLIGVAIAGGILMAAMGGGKMLEYPLEGAFVSLTAATIYASFRDIFGRDD
jgi:uncharacterized membrane protein